MKRWIPWLVAALVLGLVVAGVLRGVAARKAAQTAAPRAQAVAMDVAASEIFTLRERELAVRISVSGAVRAVESATIKARVAGELQGLSLREGDAVRAGQEVARVDATEAQARVRQVQQQADAARAQVAISQRQFDNNRALVAQGFISKTALESSQSNLDAARASYQAAVAAADVVRKSLADTVLRSPIDGLVAQRLVQNGERVGVDAKVLEVVNLGRLEMEALVPAAEATQVRVGQQAQLKVEGSDIAVQAHVARISPAAQPGSRAVPVYLSIDAGAPGSEAVALRQGVFLQGSVIAGVQQVLAVPLDAVRTDQPEPYLQIVQDAKVVHSPVRLGLRTSIHGAPWVAIEGVEAGMHVLTARVGALPAGTALNLPKTQPLQKASSAPALESPRGLAPAPTQAAR